jgi:hypothetical protein
MQGYKKVLCSLLINYTSDHLVAPNYVQMGGAPVGGRSHLDQC